MYSSAAPAGPVSRKPPPSTTAKPIPRRPHSRNTPATCAAGSAEEVAQAILWLLSDEASYVTSAIFDVSGGR